MGFSHPLQTVLCSMHYAELSNYFAVLKVRPKSMKASALLYMHFVDI